MKKALRVVDLFSGAGGFSEGFRQMGFDIVFATDKWNPAVMTFKNNFRKTKVVGPVDIMDIDIRDIPEADVIIGGPPCTFFSSSNKGGNGDVEKGMQLVSRFLEIVEEKSPRWWIMENVPRLKPHLTQYLSKEGFSQKTKTIEIEVFNANEYGVPQRRKRLFSGEYPIPDDAHGGTLSSPTLKEVIDSLPHPLDTSFKGVVKDPLYGLEMPYDEITDHMYDTFLSEIEIEDVRRVKTRHRYYGKMNFPDSLDVPARTVMASVSKISRESTIIYEWGSPKKGYRIPTVRENAIIQSFPLTFQFYGNTISDRYRLVGNAVPPLLAQKFAKAILEDDGRDVPSHPIIEGLPSVKPQSLSMNAIPRKSKRPLSAKYHDFIGSSVRHSRKACRVDLENRTDSPFLHPLYKRRKVRHIVRWKCSLHIGYAKTHSEMNIDMETVLCAAKKGEDDILYRRLRDFIAHDLEDVVKEIPDASSVQARYARYMSGIFTPDEIRGRIETLANRMSDGVSSNILETKHLMGIPKEIEMTYLDFSRLFLCHIFADAMNRSDEWLSRHSSKAFIHHSWGMPNKRVKTKYLNNIQAWFLSRLDRG